MNFLKKLIGKIKSFFIKDKVVYTYDILYAITDNIDVVLPDIVSYNTVIKNILKDNDLLNNSDYKHIPKMNGSTIRPAMLSGWCIGGVKMTKINGVICKDQLIKDINKEINLFLNLSDKLINQFNTLKEIKKNEVEFKYNIRLVEPFITNIGNIRYLLLIKVLGK